MRFLVKLLVLKPQPSPKKNMDGYSLAVFCICDDLLKRHNHPDDREPQMSYAGVMTTLIISASQLVETK